MAEAVVVEDFQSFFIRIKNHHKSMSTYWRAREFTDGPLEVQSLVIRVEGGATQQCVVTRFALIVAKPASQFFRSVDEVLPAVECRVLPTREALEDGHIGLGQLFLLL